MNAKTVFLSTAVLLTLSLPAWAHPQPGAMAASGFAAGFLHPWAGLDHLLAMFAVGLLGVQFGSRTLWLLPGLFLGGMLAGGAWGVGSPHLPWLETGVAASVVALGLALALPRYSPAVLAGIVVAASGLVHGHAHGVEMPALASPSLYALGFVSATTLLHGLGLAAGVYFIHSNRPCFSPRLAGAALALAGVCLLAEA